jgi:hypothetical protein
MDKKNKWPYQLINQFTYWTYLIVRKRTVSNSAVETLHSPLWITGLFRSGTSLTAQIIKELGGDLGPDSHLLKGIRFRKELNPDGFFENYLFMDWSLQVFQDLNSWGHLPPSVHKVESYHQNINAKEFAYNSIVKYHDDRISNLNKVKVLQRFSGLNLDQYLKKHFQGRITIKNPHFAVLFPILNKKWPKSTFLVVFRNPDDTISSAKQVTATADYKLYCKYYEGLLNDTESNQLYLDYDQLLSFPKQSVEALASHLKLDKVNLETPLKLIDPKRAKHRGSTKGNWTKEVQFIYNSMQKRAINSAK